VERIAVRVLGHPDPQIVSDASRVLAARGSVAARHALERRLLEIRSEIAAAVKRGTEADREKVEALERSGGSIASALNGAKAWTLAPEDYDRLNATCTEPVSDDWRSRQRCGRASGLRDAADPAHQVRLSLSSRGDRELDVSVDDYHGSLGDLIEKLRQYARGTRFHWDDRTYFGDSLERWTQSERDELFERVRREAAVFGILLQRERTFRTPADPAGCSEWPSDAVVGETGDIDPGRSGLLRRLRRHQ
jgi:hypothetical protein